MLGDCELQTGVHMYVNMYVCMYVCMYLCAYVKTSTYTHVDTVVCVSTQHTTHKAHTHKLNVH